MDCFFVRMKLVQLDGGHSKLIQYQLMNIPSWIWREFIRNDSSFSSENYQELASSATQKTWHFRLFPSVSVFVVVSSLSCPCFCKPPRNAGLWSGALKTWQWAVPAVPSHRDHVPRQRTRIQYSKSSHQRNYQGHTHRKTSRSTWTYK